MTTLTPVYLTEEELIVLAVGLAKSLDPSSDPRDAWEAATVVWNVPARTVIQGSLATMMAEATPHR